MEANNRSCTGGRPSKPFQPRRGYSGKSNPTLGERERCKAVRSPEYEETKMPAAPIAFGREFFEVDPRTTALIVIDMQNAFVAEGATYETPGARMMMPH